MKHSRLIWNDWLVIAGLALAYSSVSITNYIITSLPLALETARNVEANPLARAAMTTEFSLILVFTVATAAFLALYAYIRPRRHKHPKTFLFLTFLVFLTGLRDFANDFPILLKLILAGG